MRSYAFKKNECTPKNFALYLDARDILVKQETYLGCYRLVKDILLDNASDAPKGYYRPYADKIAKAIGIILNNIDGVCKRYVYNTSIYQRMHADMINTLDDSDKYIFREKFDYETNDNLFRIYTRSTGYAGKVSYFIEPMEIILYTAFRDMSKTEEQKDVLFSEFDYFLIRDIIFNATDWYRENLEGVEEIA